MKTINCTKNEQWETEWCSFEGCRAHVGRISVEETVETTRLINMV